MEIKPFDYRERKERPASAANFFGYLAFKKKTL